MIRELQQVSSSFSVHLLSLWLFAWLGGGGTKEPVMTQEAPEAGRDVGLMYSFSSLSDDSFSALDIADADRDLTQCRTSIIIHLY